MEFFIHHFVFILPQYTTNQFDGQLKVDLLSQLVRELHRYRRARGLNPDKPEFFRFQVSFTRCLSCVFIATIIFTFRFTVIYKLKHKFPKLLALFFFCN